jgi:hypothetical protein
MHSIPTPAHVSAPLHLGWRLAAVGLLLAEAAACQAEFISASNRVDIAHDAARNLLYISSGTSVLRYDLASKSFVSPIQLSGSLSGVDLSPDGNTLAVADRDWSEPNVWIHLVNLKTLTDDQVCFPRAPYEGGTYSVAWGADGAVLVSSTFVGTGSVPLRRYDPATSNTLEITSISQSSMLSASADRATIAIEESHNSSGPVHRYGVAAKCILNSARTDSSGYEVGVSRDGTQLAAPGYQRTCVYNAQMMLIANVGAFAGHPISVAYHPSKDAVYFAWSGTKEVRAFDTYNFSQLGAFTTSTTFSDPSGAAFKHGRLKISQDGLLLFVTTTDGIDWFTNNFAVPEYRWLAISGSPQNVGAPSSPGYGTNAVLRNTVVTNLVPSVVEQAGVRYVPGGATLTGATAVLNASNQISFVMSNDVSVAWKWQVADYQLTVSAAGIGTVSTTGGWFCRDVVTPVTATPNPGSRFVRWLGDVVKSDTTNHSLFVTMDQPRTIIAWFAPTNGSGTLKQGGWPTFGGGPAHTGHVPGELAGAHFSNRWSKVLGDRLHQVAVGEGHVYAAGWNNDTPFVAALRQSSGEPSWRHFFPSDLSVNPPTYDSGTIFLQRTSSSDTQLSCFDADTGQVRWSKPLSLQGTMDMAVTVADHKVWGNYWGNYSGLYGFNQTDGTLLFRQEIERYCDWTPAYYDGRLFTWVAGYFREHAPAQGDILWSTNIALSWPGYAKNTTIALDSDLAFFVGNPNLYAVSLSAKAIVWHADGLFHGTPAAANGIVYATCGNTVESYSSAGQHLARYVAGEILQTQPIVTHDALIVASSNSTYVFDLFTQELRQTIPFGGELSLAEGILYIVSFNGEVRALSSGNDLQLVVAGNPGAYGTLEPNGYGTNWYDGVVSVTNQVSTMVETNLTRYQCVGWIGTGSVPATGTSNWLAFVLATNSTLTWQWTPVAYQLHCQILGSGRVDVTNSWFPLGQDITLTATPSNGFRFVRWMGEVPEGMANKNPLPLRMTQGRRLMAVFRHADQSPLAEDWPTFGNGPAHTGYSPGELRGTTFKLRWQALIGGNLQQAAVGANRIFITPYQYYGSAFLAAVHEYSGRIAWQYDFAPCFSVNPPTYDSGSVYIQRCYNSDTHLWSFDAITGKPNWQSRHGAQSERYMAPTVADGGVWINGGVYGGIYGFNQVDGSQRFFQSLEQKSGWTPSSYFGGLYTQVGMFRAHDPMTGNVLWSTNTSTSSGGGVTTTLAISDGRAYFIGSPNLFAVDLASHALALRIDGKFSGYPAIANGFIYAISNTQVAAFTTAGQFVGNYTANSSLEFQPIVTDDTLMVSSSSATYVFDLSTFELIQTLPIGGYLSLANGVVYVAAPNGELYAYSSGHDITLTVSANGPEWGNPDPFTYGTNWIVEGRSIAPSVTSPVPGPDGTRYVVDGWTGTGSAPPTGTSNSLRFVITNDSNLTWLWKTQYFLATGVNSSGTINVNSGWYDAGTIVNLTATPSNNFHFGSWQGSLNGTNPLVEVTLDGPLLITAIFQPDTVTNNTPVWWLAKYGLPLTDTAALLDSDGDGLPNWREYLFRTEPLFPDTDGDNYNDGLETAWSSSPTDSSSVPLVQLIVSGSPENYATPENLGYGTNHIPLLSLVTNAVDPAVPGTNGQRFVCVGWTGTGDVPTVGTSNTVVFEAQTNSTLTWLWQTQFQLTAQVVSNGFVTPVGGWFNADGNVTISATPAAYFDFDHWAGDLQGSANPASLAMTGSKSVTAFFVAQLATNNVPKWWLATNSLPVSDAATLADTDGDGLINWQEFQYHTDPKLADTDGDGYSDSLEVACGSDPTLSSNVPCVTVRINSSPAAIGSPRPQGYGTYLLPLFANVTNSVADLVYQSSGTRYQSLGWSGSGDVPLGGGANQVIFNLNTNSTLTWLWGTQHALTITTNFSTEKAFVSRYPLATLFPVAPGDCDGFGWSVAMDGEVAVVGAPFHQGTNSSIIGGAYIFRRSGTNWNYEAFLDGADTAPKSFVGCTVAVSSNRVAIGALTQSAASRYCTAYVYAKLGSTWSREAVLATAQPAVNWDAWGITLNQNFLAIGASGDSSRGSLAGAVYVFWRSSGSWPYYGQRLTPTESKPYQYFGWSVATGGSNLLVVGAPGDTVGRSYSGAAYVFRVNGPQSFLLEAKLAPTNAAPQAQFGASVSAAEDLLTVGAPSDETLDVPSGAAYVYARTNGVWRNTARLSPDSCQPYAAFGNCVAMTVDHVLVGAPLASGGSSHSGSAWLYRFNGTCWQPQARLAAGAITGLDQFGWAVALGLNAALVGAPEADQSAIDGGAALVFDTWGADAPTAWWSSGTLASAPTAPEMLSRSNITYRFVEWQLDGVRQAGVTSSALNPLPGVMMNSPHEATAIYLAETDDTDGDSLPDWWERRYLATLATDTADDSDSDGFLNGLEWLSGTNPADGAFPLRLTASLDQQSQATFLVLRWNSTPGWNYRIYSAPTPSGSFSCLITNLVATPPINQVSVPIQADPMFFKLELVQ